ncbi:hypothetical protein [Streptomyces sp. NPDC020965]|uniref:hypothetical protein n=1 Tax=Streptomyces sp. NPDC020965 TaxID=3365105 RepID=UPI0037AC8ACB
MSDRPQSLRLPSGEFRVFCDRAITSGRPAERVGDAVSMSGARPDQWSHEGCGPRARHWDPSWGYGAHRVP